MLENGVPRVLENGMPRRCSTQRERREQGTGDKVHNVELHDLYSTIIIGPSKMMEVLRDVTSFKRGEL